MGLLLVVVAIPLKIYLDRKKKSHKDSFKAETRPTQQDSFPRGTGSSGKQQFPASKCTKTVLEHYKQLAYHELRFC